MTNKIRMGALLGPVPNGAAPNFLVEQAKTYVAEGFNSLWAAQSMGRGFMWTDPFVTMTIAATVSQDVEVGSAIVQIPLYHPGDFAHRVVSLHQLLGDRLILGLGAGSTGADFDLVGRDSETRFSMFTESVAALRAAYESGSDANKALSPWPHMTTPPKLFFGTWGKGVERAVQEFDGWIASGHYRSVEELEASAVRYHAAGGGRAIVSTLMIDGDTDLGEFREKLARFAEAGFNDAVVLIQPGGPAPDVVRKLTD